MFKVQNNDRSVQRSVSTFRSITHSGPWRPVVPSARSTQLASDVTWLWRTARPSQTMNCLFLRLDDRGPDVSRRASAAFVSQRQSQHAAIGRVVPRPRHDRTLSTRLFSEQPRTDRSPPAQFHRQIPMAKRQRHRDPWPRPGADFRDAPAPAPRR